MTGLRMSRCKSCGHVQFPPGLLCSTCHAAEFEAVNAAEGTVATVTSSTSGDRSDVQFAEVQSDLGPTVVALITGDESWPGQRVFFSAGLWPEARTTLRDDESAETE